ncbi:MAG TPA: hypothetical protein VJU79_10620 [Candidatus Dormibacteraeota bacterium]|nr:hypothetical protein [Candidatus Dormibacteraeota bacterium]
MITEPEADEPAFGEKLGVSVRLHLFEAPGVELRRALRPPWPDWMGAVYQLEQASNEQIDVSEAAVTASAAVGALSSELRHRLETLSFVCGALETLGWSIRLDGDTLVASAVLSRAEAREQLERAGVAGPMCKVADVDEDGWPRLAEGGALRGEEPAP